MFSTTPLYSHLRNYHQELYDSLQVQRSETVPVSTTSKRQDTTQPTIQMAFQATKKWSFDHENAKKIHVLIGEMIATDCQPLSMVTDSEFARLVNHLEPRYNIPSRTYFRDVVIPGLYEKMVTKMRSFLSGQDMISITRDIWTHISSGFGGRPRCSNAETVAD